MVLTFTLFPKKGEKKRKEIELNRKEHILGDDPFEGSGSGSSVEFMECTFL